MLATLKKCLNSINFNWDRGRIFYQEVYEGSAPGWASEESRFPTKEIDDKHPILDHEFDCGYGMSEMPRIVCYDDKFVYFPIQYDGSTSLEKVSLKPNYYIKNEAEETPYFGG